MSRNAWIVAICAAAIAIAIAAIVISVIALGGESVDEQVSAEVDSDARCREAGVQVLAGERETVYTCTYRQPNIEGHPITSSCVAIVEGRVYGVSADPC